MGYLIHKRGLTREIVRFFELGYDGSAFVIPVKDVQSRALVNVRLRYWPKVPASGGKYRGLPGRTLENGGVTLFPFLPPGPIILVAGEFDAMILWRHDLPGVTVTSGAATKWPDAWDWMVKDRRVAVMFDADPREEQQATSRAEQLRRAGAEDAWVVRLSTAGLGNGEDVTDWFVKYRRTKKDLIRLINGERGSRRRRTSR
jgi:hypothetical protein